MLLEKIVEEFCTEEKSPNCDYLETFNRIGHTFACTRRLGHVCSTDGNMALVSGGKAVLKKLLRCEHSAEIKERSCMIRLVL